MDSEDEEMNYINKESLKHLEARSTLVLMSSINNKISIHTNINKDVNRDELIMKKKNDNKDTNNYNNTIYDVNAATKSLNTFQIIKLIDESIDTIKYFDQWIPIWLKDRDGTDDNKHSDVSSNESDNVGLSRRVKGAHLTQDQILYLKDFIDNSNLTTRELWIKF